MFERERESQTGLTQFYSAITFSSRLVISSVLFIAFLLLSAASAAGVGKKKRSYKIKAWGRGNYSLLTTNEMITEVAGVSPGRSYQRWNDEASEPTSPLHKIDPAGLTWILLRPPGPTRAAKSMFKYLCSMVSTAMVALKWARSIKMC